MRCRPGTPVARVAQNRDPASAVHRYALHRARGTTLKPRHRHYTKSRKPRLLEQRIGHIAELAHALLIARKRHQHAVEARARERRQRIDHLLLGADHRQPAPALDEGLLQRPDPLGRNVALVDLERKRLDHVPGRLPVALLADVVVVEIARLLLGLALHDVDQRPDLDLAAVGLARELVIGRTCARHSSRPPVRMTV